MLNVLGAERQRLLLELEARRPNKTPAQPTGPAPERPVVAKPRPAAARASDDKGTDDAKGKAPKSGKGKGKSDKPDAKSSPRR